MNWKYTNMCLLLRMRKHYSDMLDSNSVDITEMNRMPLHQRYMLLFV